LVELSEPDVDVLEAGVLELGDLLEVAVAVGPADDHLGDVLLGDVRRRLLEVARQRKLLA
jgi:hypothetical protein